MNDGSDNNEGINECAALALQWFIERGAATFLALPIADQMAHAAAAHLDAEGYRRALQYVGSYWEEMRALPTAPVGGNG
jgi:hypothetical protein